MTVRARVPRRRHVSSGVAASVASVALVTFAIELLKGTVPVLSLGVLYVLAVLVVAVGWGLAYAIPVAVASMLAFNWFHLPPVHTFSLTDSENWFALAVYVATAIVVSALATRVRDRAREAEQREREASLLAEIASSLLGGTHVAEELDRIATGVAVVLGVSEVSIALGPDRAPIGDQDPHPLIAGDRHVGTLFMSDREEADLRRPAALPPCARFAAGGGRRSGDPAPGGIRDRGAAPQRHGQDGGHPGRLA